MNAKLLVFVILEQIVFNTLPVSGVWPYNLNTPLPYSTPTPIAIESSQAIPLVGLPPLVFNIPHNDEMNVTNNGATILAMLNQLNSTTMSTVSGGILGNQVFKFNHIFVILNNKYGDRCATTIDGEGTPIEFVHVYVNTKYLSFRQALKERDGLAIIVKRIKVEGNIPNPLFPPFQVILEKIKYPGSSIIVPALDVYQWYNILPNYSSYYAYPGSYIDISDDKEYQAATVFIFAGTEFPYISIPQFKAFQDVIGSDGLQLANTVSTYEKGLRPLVQASGIKANMLG